MKEEQEEVAAENITVDNQISRIVSNSQKVSDELEYNTRAITSASNHLVSTVIKAEDQINKMVSSLEQCVTKQEKIISEINTESRMLAMIPEKMQNRISEIVPQIATEVEKIYNSKVEEIRQQFELIEKTLLNTAKSTSAILEQNIDQFTKDLIQGATTAATSNMHKLLKNLALVVMFSGIVSSITAYVVTNNFLRYVRVENVNDLSVHNSTVSVWRKMPQNEQNTKIKTEAKKN